MAAPTTLINGTAVIASANEGNGVLKLISPLIQGARLRVGFSGTYASAVVAIRQRIRGINDDTTGGVYYGMQGRNGVTGAQIASSASISLADNTAGNANAFYEFDASAADQVEIYAVSGTLTDLVVEERVSPSSGDAGGGSIVSVTLGTAPIYAADVSLNDDIDLVFGTGLDAQFRWSTGDASNHSLVLALGDSNQALHISDVGAVATDWNVSADTHPTVYIHSNTTPATDYLLVGAHDGTSAYINVAGGTTLNLQAAGVTGLAMVGLKVFMGDTTHANLTQGLVINQGAADDLILALKSSDVATGLSSIVTGDVETDDYFAISKFAAATGARTSRSWARTPRSRPTPGSRATAGRPAPRTPRPAAGSSRSTSASTTGPTRSPT
jgi:hypothetical protein